METTNLNLFNNQAKPPTVELITDINKYKLRALC